MLHIRGIKGNGRLSYVNGESLFDETNINLQSHFQTSYEMNAALTLNTISSIIQFSYKVETRHGVYTPLGLFGFIIADISDRKNSVTRELTEPIYLNQKKIDFTYKVDEAKFLADLTAHKSKLRGLTSAIANAVKKGSSTEQLEENLRTLKLNEPVKPVHIKFIINPSTFERAIELLHNHLGVTSWSITDGGNFFDSGVARHSAFMADAWSGDRVGHETKTAGSFDIENPRIAILLAVQPGILKTFLATKQGQAWLSSGTLARFLTCYPRSTKGNRIVYLPTPAPLNIDSYKRRMTELMESITIDQIKNPVILRFQEDARRELTMFANELEWNQLSNGSLADVSGAAGKMAENTARVAANLHVFEKYRGDIGLDITRKAIGICRYYMTEYKCLFGDIQLIDQALLDGQSIINEMLRWADNFGTRPYPKSRAAQFASTQIRKDKFLREAVFAQLIHNGIIFPYFLQGSKIQYICLTDKGLHLAQSFRAQPMRPMLT